MKNKSQRISDNPRAILVTKAHKLFDPLWQKGKFLNRESAYYWLANKLDISPANCHFGNMTEDQLKQAIKVIKKF